MIAVDTNILVRFLTRDDDQQFKKAHALFDNHDVFIPDTVILETEWVLRYAYGFSSTVVCNAFNKLFGLPGVYATNPVLIAQAIQWHGLGLDFADAMHLSLSQQHDHFYSFDNKFVRRASGLSQCSVLKP